jgi:hypothetical protein
MLYVVIDKDTGAQKRVSLEPLFQMSATEEVLTFPEITAHPSPEEYEWNKATKEYVALPGFAGAGPVARTRLTKREFLQRLDSAGALDAIMARLATAPVTPQEVAIVAALMKFDRYLITSDFIELTHPKTTGGIAQLVAVGFLTQAAAEVVLTPATTATAE